MDRAAPHAEPGNLNSPAQDGVMRNQIACETCRQHKQKCDGAYPCKKCAQRNVACLYRTKKRPRRKPRAAGVAPRRQTAAHRSLFPSVRASQDTAGASGSELYYGPSSNFSLMQHLHRRMDHDAGGPRPDAGDVQDAGDGLDKFHYRNVCFHSQLASFKRPTQDQLLIDHPRYLDAYFETVGVLFPVVRETDLRDRLCQWQASDHVPHDSIHRAILITALAVGALFCNARDQGEGLLQLAQDISNESRHIINTDVVVLNFLMIRTPAEFLDYALYYDCAGRYNLAYLQNGHACRVAHAVGLHQISPRSSHSPAIAPDGYTIYRALFVQESFLCTALGLPAALQCVESAVTESQDFPLLEGFFRVAKVSVDIKKMHQDTNQSMEAFLRTRDLLVARLHDVVRYMNESLGIDLGRQMQVKDCGVHPMLLKLEYELALLLVHRPLMIFQTVSMRVREQKSGTNGMDQPTAATANVDQVDGTTEAVEAARRLIMLAEEILREKNPVVHFSKLAFYLESACFVLIFDSLQSKELLTVNSHHVEKAVEVLAKLTNKTSTLDMIVGIRTMLDRALVIALSTMSQNSTLPAEASTYAIDLREVTKAVEVGLEQTDMKVLFR